MQRKRRGALITSRKSDSSISERLNLLSSPIPSDFNPKSLELEVYEKELKKLEDDYNLKKKQLEETIRHNKATEKKTSK